MEITYILMERINRGREREREVEEGTNDRERYLR